jgi:hypothetical protein
MSKVITMPGTDAPRVVGAYLPEPSSGGGPGHEKRQLPWYARIPEWMGLHQGPWEYLADGKCSQMRICQWCGEASLRVKHRPTWEYVKEGSCDQTKICARCAGNRGGIRVRHDWGLSYGPALGHDHARDCQRCPEKQTWDNDASD